MILPADRESRFLMNREPPLIEHNPNEGKRDWTWAIGWVVVALMWAGYWTYLPFQWEGIMLGLGTGICLACWAIDITGNKVPESWRGKPPRSR